MTLVRSTIRMPFNAPAMFAPPKKRAENRAASLVHLSQEAVRFPCYAGNTMSPLCKERRQCSDDARRARGAMPNVARKQSEPKAATSTPRPYRIEDQIGY